MKTEDIVRQIAGVLPKYTDKFSETLDISAMTKSGTTVTVTTSTAHGLVDSSYVIVNGIKQINTVDTLTQVDGVATVTCDDAHDLTYGFNQSVTIEGSTNGYDGTYTIDEVTTNKSAEFTVSDALATPATGTITMIENRFGYNGRFQITVLSTTQFTYDLSEEPLLQPYFDDGSVRGDVRITGATSKEAIVRNYSRQVQDAWWGFVVLGNVSPSKDRKTTTDTTYDYANGEYKQQLIHDFSFLVVVPSGNNAVSARPDRDDVEEIRPYLFKSLLGVKFDSGLVSGNKMGVVANGESMFDEFNGAYFIYEFGFQMPFKVVSGGDDDNNGDIVGLGDTSAFREFEVSYVNSDEQTLKVIQGDLPDEES